MSKRNITKLKIAVYDPNDNTTLEYPTYKAAAEDLVKRGKTRQCSGESVGRALRENALLWGRFKVTKIK